MCDFLSISYIFNASSQKKSSLQKAPAQDNRKRIFANLSPYNSNINQIKESEAQLLTTDKKGLNGTGYDLKQSDPTLSSLTL